MTRRTKLLRGGTVAVEAAVVMPILLIFILGLTVGGLGIYRYQEISLLAREGSRWASVHGSTYQSDAGNANPVTAAQVYSNAMQPFAVALDTSKLSYTVTYSPNMNPPSSTVTVTVTYQWFPEVYLIGPINLSCSSTRLMCY
jgi:Flp pilus assembly protein TadG